MTCTLDKFLSGKCKDKPHIVKEFISFLYRQGVYGKYIFYYANTSHHWKQEYHHEWGDPLNFISAAFRWYKTPEKHPYWESIDKMWRSELKHKV